MKIEEKLCRVLLILAREFRGEVDGLRWERQTGRTFDGVDRPFIIRMERNHWLNSYHSEILETQLRMRCGKMARMIIKAWRSMDTPEYCEYALERKACHKKEAIE